MRTTIGVPHATPTGKDHPHVRGETAKGYMQLALMGATKNAGNNSAGSPASSARFVRRGLFIGLS